MRACSTASFGFSASRVLSDDNRRIPSRWVTHRRSAGDLPAYLLQILTPEDVPRGQSFKTLMIFYGPLVVSHNRVSGLNTGRSLPVVTHAWLGTTGVGKKNRGFAASHSDQRDLAPCRFKFRYWWELSSEFLTNLNFNDWYSRSWKARGRKWDFIDQWSSHEPGIVILWH